MLELTIIGITGLSGSGKDTLAGYLRTKDFEYGSLSDRIREVCRQRGLATDRDNLIKIANELRARYGYAELAKRTLRKIEHSRKNKFVLVSLRHPDEVDYLRQHGGMKLVLVKAALRLRYQRNKNRGRPEDSVSFEKFCQQEEKEKKGSNNQQQLDRVMSMADYVIFNNGSLKQLEQQVDKMLNEMENS